ncbi:hypothetical protein [Alteromonas gilva]|uniref:Solute-binding protein family 3/N-terminal domain-containing protein n=1 Tax=Alteromonas gilva TaxID=2987522 RepID=A0ABT5L598_9ALTE|nr:hypothetical protein [Alteromonas gilva]MDC8832214.1 hypothetical protein [Alteromonas gilva]
MKAVLFALLSYMLISSHARATGEELLIPSLTAGHPVNSFLQQQLNDVLSATEDDYPSVRTIPVKIDVAEERHLRNLNLGITDVVWALCSEERNREYTPIAVPLMAGLFGYRLNVVRNNDPRFDALSTLEPLQNMIAAQAGRWLDAGILRHNGITVLDTGRYAGYRAIHRSLADFYPRSVTEIEYEIAGVGLDSVQIAPLHALHYPMVYVLYVSKTNHQLAKRLRSGFQRIIDSGRYTELLQQQPWYQSSRQLMAGRALIRLTNPNNMGECATALRDYSQILYTPAPN